MKSVKEIFNKTLELVKECGDILKDVDYEKETVAKEDGSLVTKYDLLVDKKLTEGLKQIADYPVLSEEHEENLGNNYFIIDPIDGTHNFNAGYESFGIIVAYIENEETLFSIVHCPVLDKTYTAIKGEGAYLNGKRIFVRENKPKRLIGTCGISIEGLEIINKLISSKEKIDLRSIFSVEEYCKVASGIFDFCIYHKEGLWDFIGPKLIIEEARGILRHKKLNGDKYQIIAGTQKAVEIIGQITQIL